MTSPGTGGPSGELRVDPSALSSAAGILESTAGALDGAAPGLRVRPDAGVSSDEVASALSALAEAVAGMSAEVASTAESVRTTAADVTATDQASGVASQQHRQVLLP